MPSVAEISAFFNALASNWIALMSGLAGIILQVLAYLKRTQRSFQRFFVIGIACLLISAFLAWLDEHRLLVSEHQRLAAELEKNAPQLSCEINQVAHGAQPGGTVAVLIATVRNVGAPSIAEDYEMGVVLMDGSEVRGRVMTIPERLPIQTPNGTVRVIQGSRSLYNKTVEPVIHNGMKRGYLVFAFPGVPYEKMSASAKDFRLSLRDVYRKLVQCSRPPD